ncbi:hypothetical protein GCM10020295_47650 [Streptomyces cinereospinus]
MRGVRRSGAPSRTFTSHDRRIGRIGGGTRRPTRRAALAGLVGGAGAVLAAGCTPTGAAPAAAPSPSGTASAPAGGAAPGAMTLFEDPAYNFSALMALGGAGAGAAETGEVLTAVNAVDRAGLSAQSYVTAFKKLGDQLMAAPEGGGADDQTTRWRALRAAQYYAQALFFVLGSDDPGSEERLYRAGRRAWDRFCDLCDPAPVKAAVPYGRTPLPVWFFRPEGAGGAAPR